MNENFKNNMTRAWGISKIKEAEDIILCDEDIIREKYGAKTTSAVNVARFNAVLEILDDMRDKIRGV